MSNLPLVVLAGGLGTRLSAVVSDVPKPLAPVNGRPFLYYLLANWRQQEIEHFIFLIHHKADKMQEFILAEKNNGILQDCEVQVVLEDKPLGTGGAVANAVKTLNMQGHFLVANADTYMEAGITDLSAATFPAIATVFVENASRYGSMKTAEGKIISFEEKRPVESEGFINAGLYHLHALMFAGWDGEPFSMEKDVFEKMVPHRALRAVFVDSVFIDIGIPEDYLRFCNWVETGKQQAL